MIPLALTADDGLMRFNASMLTDQTILESIVAQCDDETLAKFTDADGEFLDVCSWEAIYCDRNDNVTKIDWLRTLKVDAPVHVGALPPHLAYFWIGFGEAPLSIDLSALPASLECFGAKNIMRAEGLNVFDLTRLPEGLKRFTVLDCSLKQEIVLDGLPPALEYLHLQRNKLHGSFPFEALPQTISDLSIDLNRFVGTVPLTALPACLRWASFDSNKFHGSIDLTQLPTNLGSICLSRNAFTGDVNLRALPVALEALYLEVNQLTGTLDLTALPATLEYLGLFSNEFHGSIDLTALPEGMRRVDAASNKLTGELDLTNLPGALNYLDLSFNLFTGRVDLSRLPECLWDLDLSYNELQGPFDRSKFAGEPHALGLHQRVPEMPVVETEDAVEEDSEEPAMGWAWYCSLI